MNPESSEISEILRNNKRIAVVGLSNNPERTSYKVAQVMQNAGYEIIPVNPGIDEALGVKAVSSLKEIDGQVDIVNVFRKSEFLLEVAEETVAINAKVFWSQLGLLDEDAYNYLKKHDTTVVMDHCIKIELARMK